MRRDGLFYIITIGFASGVFVRSFFVIENLVIYLLLAICIIGVVGTYQFRRTPVGYRYFLLALVGLSLAVGMWRFTVMESALATTVLSSQVGETVTITGRVSREPDYRERTALVTVATVDTQVLVITDVTTPVRYGDTVAVTGKLATPEAFTTEYDRTFDYPGYLAARGVTHTMSFVTPEIVKSAPAYHPLVLLYDRKQIWIDQLALVLPEPQLGLGLGLLLGVQSALGDDLEDAFRTAGITHIVVLSGYNIMLVVAFVMYVLAFLLPFRGRLLVGIGAVITFALLVGYSPSVMRASLMAILFLLASLTARKYLLLRALLVAAALMIFINPYILRFDVGFQLSFLATLGLVLVLPQFELWFYGGSKRLRWREYLGSTVVTQIAVSPVILYAIGAWSLVAVPVNILVLPMVPVAMMCTFITGILALVVPPLAIVMGYVTYASLTYIILIATYAAALPFAEIVVPPFPGYVVFILYAGMGGWWYWYTRARITTVVGIKPMKLNPSYQTWTIIPEEVLRIQLTTPGPAKANPGVSVTTEIATQFDSPLRPN